jgi:hypothetical protein
VGLTVYCHLRRQAFKIIKAFKIVWGIVKNRKIRIPILLRNLPTQHEAEERRLKLVYYPE